MSRWSLALVCSTLLLVAVPRVGTAPLTADYVDAVTGWEWAGLDQTEATSWNEVAAVCAQDGVTPCSGNIRALEFIGWIWATRDQVRDLWVNATDLTAANLADYIEEQVDSTWGPQVVSAFTPNHHANS